jgi:hypothetical protein
MTSKALRQFVSGVTNPKGNLGDFAHASRLFVDSDLRLAPKRKFNYHVVFKINPNSLKSLNFKYQHVNEINMLVKTADLPKFTLQTETLNQYNRKKIVQTKIDYQPVNIKFHDDNLGVVGQLWQNYYGYYYGDTAAANIQGAYKRNATEGPAAIRARYGLDNNSSAPFFEYIEIFQMAKRAFYSYKLINPVITSWSHDSLDYSSNTPSEQSMQIAYESVAYNTGYVGQGSPPGFGGPEHYDTMPSPISLIGGGTRTLFGQAGVLAGAEAVFGSLGSGAAFNSPANFISTAITAVNTYQNAKNLTKAGVTAELTNLTVKGLTSLASIGMSGIQNISFPVFNPSSTTSATPRNLLGGGGP